MASFEFSDDDLREMHALLQGAALKAYPNPKRIGCPGTPVLQTIAETTNPSDNPAYEHVSTCSPCLEEMVALRSERVRDLSARRNRRLVTGISAIAALLFLSIAAYWFVAGRKVRSQPRQVEVSFNDRSILPVEVGRLDFKVISAQRGSDSGPQRQQVVSDRVKELLINLPVGSESGRYELEIRDPATVKRELVATGTMISGNPEGGLVLKALVDLSKVSAGPHIAAWHLVDSQSWDFGTFAVQARPR